MNEPTVSIIRKVAKIETVDIQRLIQGCKNGSVVILTSKNLKVNPVGIGLGLKIKVNANLGASPGKVKLKNEITKLNLAVESGCDTVMDLSIDGDIDHIRKVILRESRVPVGSCPVYQVFANGMKEKKPIGKIDKNNFLEIIEKQAADGISFMGLHCAFTLKSLEEYEKAERITGIVSRGGGLMACWMRLNKQENPLYENFNQVLRLGRGKIPL